ncbi:MAG: acyltransferase, partial [Candidatus Hodarchaeales archaeon]
MALFFIIQIILSLSIILLFFIVFFTLETFSIGLIPSLIFSVFLTYFSALLLLAFIHKISRILMRTKEGEIEGIGVILWTIQATTLDIALTLTRKLIIHSPVPDIIYSFFGFKRRKGISILTTLWDPDLINVGENTMIGTGSIVSGHHIRNKKLYRKRVTIGKNVTIGAYCIITPGAIIGDNTIVAMGSTIPANWELEPNCLYGGVPVKK